MRRRLIAIVLTGALFISVGCTSIRTKAIITDEKLQELADFCEQAFKYKDAYFMAIQIDTVKGPKIVKEMMKAGKTATALEENGHKDLAKVFDSMYVAALKFDLYLATGNAKYYSEGTTYYNNSEKLFRD